MTEHFPVTPPTELIKEWMNEFYVYGAPVAPGELTLLIAARAAQWGADTELEACCEWLDFNYPHVCITMLRADRRPEPKTQAEEALEALDRMDQLPMDQLSTAKESQRTSRFVELKNYKEDHAIVRRALERLQELEGQANG